MIPAEKFGIPQKRHRVILLGIRSDLTVPQSITLRPSSAPSVCDVISDLPPLRSQQSREDDDAEAWETAIRELLQNLRSHGLPTSVLETMTGALGCLKRNVGVGRRSVPKTPGRLLPRTALTEWLIDPAMDFVVNHETRKHMKEDLLRYRIDAREQLRSGKLRRGARHFDNPIRHDGRRKVSEYALMMRGWPGFEAPEKLMDHAIRFLPRDYDLFARLSSGDQYPQAEARQEDMFGWRRSELASALS